MLPPSISVGLYYVQQKNCVNLKYLYRLKEQKTKGKEIHTEFFFVYCDKFPFILFFFLSSHSFIIITTTSYEISTVLISNTIFQTDWYLSLYGTRQNSGCRKIIKLIFQLGRGFQAWRSAFSTLTFTWSKIPTNEYACISATR